MVCDLNCMSWPAMVATVQSLTRTCCIDIRTAVVPRGTIPVTEAIVGLAAHTEPRK